MTVYVGVSMWPYGRMIMCHMFATTDEELETMARSLGLKPAWRQKPRASIGPHYDVSKGKRAEAIRLGAVACDDIHAEVEAFDLVETARGNPKVVRRRRHV